MKYACIFCGCYLSENILSVFGFARAKMTCLYCSKEEDNILVNYNSLSDELYCGFINFIFNGSYFYYRLMLLDDESENLKQNTSQLVLYENEKTIINFDGFPYNPNNIQDLIARMPTIVNFQ